MQKHSVNVNRKPLFVLESMSTDPFFNLALEEYFFEKKDNNHNYLILWQNYRTIVIGKYQNTYAEINAKYVKEHHINVARRLSGGGAVYHDDGNLNYTLILNDEGADSFDFSRYVSVVADALKKVGINACFNGRNDITIDGMKISGSSQYFRKGKLLHHGCIMLDSNLADVADALNVSKAKFEGKAVKSVKSRVTTINQHMESPMTMSEFKQLMIEQFCENENAQHIVLTEKQKSDICKLRDEKYIKDEWNYGKSPACSIKKERKFPSGLVSVYMTVKNQRIQEIHIYGDFFGNEDIRLLEEMISGNKMDESLLHILEDSCIDRFMAHITAKDLYALIME